MSAIELQREAVATELDQGRAHSQQLDSEELQCVLGNWRRDGRVWQPRYAYVFKCVCARSSSLNSTKYIGLETRNVPLRYKYKLFWGCQ